MNKKLIAIVISIFVMGVVIWNRNSIFKFFNSGVNQNGKAGLVTEDKNSEMGKNIDGKNTSHGNAEKESQAGDTFEVRERIIVEDTDVVVLGIGGLAAAALTEDKLILETGGLVLKAVAVHVDAVLTLLGAAQQDLVALLDVAVFHNGDVAVVAEDHAGVHTALLSHVPLTVYLEVFGENAQCMILLGSHAVKGCGNQDAVWSIGKLFPGKIRCGVFFQLKHKSIPLSI